MKQTLEREHRAALASDRAARTFKQFRLNIPGDPVDSQPLITTAEWERVCARAVPACEGKPIVGVDLGGNRSWSAAASIWPSGRIESWALAPGVPTLAEQEHADHVADDSYLELARSGGLTVDGTRAVPDVATLLSRVWAWEPAAIVCDPYRSAELHQAVAGRVRVIERARGGGESTSNVQSLRSLLLDTEAGATEPSRALLAAAWAQTNLVIDNAGLTRVTKLDQRRSRDDAAAALLLAAGERSRRPTPVPLRAAMIEKSGGRDVVLAPRSGSTRRWRKLRAYVLRRDGGRCQRCAGNEKLECHHVIPRTAGGLDVPSNCRMLCQICHDALHGR